MFVTFDAQLDIEFSISNGWITLENG